MYQGATSPYMVGQPYSNTTLSPHEAAAAAAAAAVDAARRVRFADDNRGAHAAGMPAAYYAPLSVPPPLTDRRTVMPLVSSSEQPQPVVPASAPAAAAAAPPSVTTDTTSKKPNRAMHESQLRAQVRVLEAEVKLLRDGLQRTATVGERNSSGGIENNNNNNRANTAKPKLAFGRRASPTRAPLARPSRSVSGSKRAEARDGLVGQPGVPSTAMTAHKELPLQGSAHGAMLLPRDNEAVSAGAVSGAGAGGYWNSAKGLYRDATAVAAAPAYVHTSPIKPPAGAAAVTNSPLGARPIQVAMSDVQIPTLPMSSAVPQPTVQPPYMPPGPIGQSTMPPPPPPPSTVSSYMYPPMSSAGTAPAMQPAAVNIPVAAAPPPPPPVVPNLPAPPPPPPPAAVTGSIPAPAAISSPVQPSDVSALQSSLLVHQRLVQQQHATIQSLSQRVLELEEVLRNSSRGSNSNTTASASAAAGAGAAGHDSRHAAMLILTNHLLHAQGEVARLTSLNEMHEKLLREKDAELVALRVACTSAAAAPGNAVSHHQPVQTAVVPPATVAVSSTVAASTSPPVVPLAPAAPPPAVAVPVAVSPVPPPPPAVNSVDAAKLAPSAGCTCKQEVEQLTRKLKAWETWFAKSQQQQQQQQQRQPGAHKKENTCAATHASPLGNNPPSDGVVYGSQQANGTCEQNDSRCIHDRPAPYTSEVVIGGGPLSRVDDNHANSAANTKGEAVKPMRSYCTVYDEVVDPFSYMHPCQHPSRPTNNNNNRPAAADAKENKKEKEKSSGGSVVDCQDEEDLTEFLARERVLRELATKERVAAEERLRAVLRHAMDMDGSDNETVATPKKRIADKEKS